jgi:uncharacterized protein (TIRG00374 family)
MKLRPKNYLAFVITIAFFAYIIIKREEIFNILKGAQPQYLLLVIISQIFLQFFNSRFLIETLKPFKVKLNGFESFKITLASSFVNYMTPVIGGVGFKGVYLKKKYDINYSEYAGIAYGTYLITGISSFIFALAGLAITGSLRKGSGEGLLALIFFGTALFLVTIAFIGDRYINFIKNKELDKTKWSHRLIEKLILINLGWQKIIKNKLLVFRLLVISLFTLLSAANIYYFAVKAAGLHTSIGSTMIFASLGIVNLLLNLTPGSIGVREGIYASVSSVTGLTLSSVVSFSLIDRTTQIIILFTSWLLWGGQIVNELDFKVKKLRQ